MLKFLILSDTHLHRSNQVLSETITDVAAKMDGIFHAGDFTGIDCFRQLEALAPITAVHGNMDCSQLQAQLPEYLEVEIERVKLGLTHGSGTPQDLQRRIRNEFQHPDLIIFGHTHTPFSRKVDGVWMFNPGSPTDRRLAPYYSYGLLEIDDGQFRIEIAKMEEPVFKYIHKDHHNQYIQDDLSYLS